MRVFMVLRIDGVLLKKDLESLRLFCGIFLIEVYSGKELFCYKLILVYILKFNI